MPANARGKACRMSAMASAGPSRTVSSIYDSVLTSEVIVLTAL